VFFLPPPLLPPMTPFHEAFFLSSDGRFAFSWGPPGVRQTVTVFVDPSTLTPDQVHVFDEAMAMWNAQNSGIQFVAVPTAAAAEVTVGGAPMRDASTLAQTTPYDGGMIGTLPSGLTLHKFARAVITFYQGWPWWVSDLPPDPNGYDFLSLALHELGHAAGLGEDNSGFYPGTNDGLSIEYQYYAPGERRVTFDPNMVQELAELYGP
jgi:hypothetical protein